MMANGLMGRGVEMAHTLTLMEESIKVNIWKMKDTARVLRPILQATLTRVNSPKAKGTVTDS